MSQPPPHIPTASPTRCQRTSLVCLNVSLSGAPDGPGIPLRSLQACDCTSVQAVFPAWNTFPFIVFVFLSSLKKRKYRESIACLQSNGFGKDLCGGKCEIFHVVWLYIHSNDFYAKRKILFRNENQYSSLIQHCRQRRQRSEGRGTVQNTKRRGRHTIFYLS